MYRLLIFCLFLTSVLHLSSSSCIRKKRRYEPEREYFLCYNSKDYKADLKKAKTVEDPTEIEFYNTDIPKLENNALEAVPNVHLMRLIMCNIKDIEDNAFQGLSKLKNLDLSENQLTTLKGIWFRDLVLERLNLAHNAIDHIEKDFAETILAMPLDGKRFYIDLKGNRLKTLPENTKSLLSETGFVNFEHNPLSYKQALTIVSWDEEYFVYPGFDELQIPSHNASMRCNNSLGMDVADEVFNNCVAEILDKDYNHRLKPKEGFNQMRKPN